MQANLVALAGILIHQFFVNRVNKSHPEETTIGSHATKITNQSSAEAELVSLQEQVYIVNQSN
jgi:hypothetical protein